MKRGHGEGTKKSQDDAAEGDFIGDDEVLEINERRDDESGQQQTIHHRQRRRLPPDGEPTAEEGRGGQQFDPKIADRDRRAAVRAPAAKKQPGEERNIEMPGNRIAAMRTMRPGSNQALSAGHPVDADVQKAPDDAAKGEER